MIYIKSSEYNITNNYINKVKNDIKIKAWSVKFVVTTLYNAIKMRFFDKIDYVSGSTIIKKVLH